MTEIYFVRHPESELNATFTTVGGRSPGAPVTERGLEQARRFAKVYPLLYPKPDVLYTSPTVRTKTLLDIYVEENNWQHGYFIDSNLQELSQGSAEGKLREEIYTPEVLELIKQQQLDFALPGGESLNQAADVGIEWLYEAAKHHPNSTLLVATHGLKTRCVVGRLLGWNHYQTIKDPANITDNVSLTSFTVKDGQASVNFWAKDIIEPVEKDYSKLY